MAYYRNYDNGYNNNGYNNNNGRRNDRGYNNRNGNWGGNYDNRDRGYSDNNTPFELLQIVRHKTTGVQLTVIGFGREQIECRKPDLSAQYFYEYELEPIDEDQG